MGKYYTKEEVDKLMKSINSTIDGVRITAASDTSAAREVI